MRIFKKFRIDRCLLILFIIILTGSCSKEEDRNDFYVNTPIAGFSYTGNDGPAPVSIQFYNSSQNADMFEWDFGDNGTSTERDPKHTFYNSSSEVKTFLVVLKATDSSSGLFQRKSKSIAIQPGG